jgi:hypothetical protein
MIKVFTGKILPGYSYVPLLYPNIGFQGKDSLLFLGNAFKDFTEPTVELVESPKQADFILLPHNYFQIKNELEYLESFRELSRSTGKKLIVFAYGDSSNKLPFDDCIILRSSQYRSSKMPNEIILPAYAEDLGKVSGMKWREKGDKPVVGFCGWAKHRGVVAAAKFNIKLIRDMLKYGSTKTPHLQGLYFRQCAIALLSKAKEVRINFILRRSYSGHKETISLDENTARSQFIENMRNSDLILSVKGDGNFSYRFFEALSMGRLPLLVDTDCVLPLEGQIDYDSFVIRVKASELEKIAVIVEDFYMALSDEEYIRRQKSARENFERLLRIDRFFNYVFDSKERLLELACM